MLHLNFNNVLREIWQVPIYSTKKFSLCMKIKALKNPLKTLNKLDFSHISRRVLRAQEAYATAQNNLMENPESLVLKARVNDCRSTTNFLLEAERLFFQQKLKNKHFLLADKGTHYIHSLD